MEAGFRVVVRGSSGSMSGGEVEAERAERVALNEVTFRRANEMIEERAEELAVTGRVPFVCECGDASCLERVELSLAEYEAVREGARSFLVAPGHAITGDRTVAATLLEPGHRPTERANQRNEPRDLAADGCGHAEPRW